MSARTPVILDAMIDRHKQFFGKDPVLIMLRIKWFDANHKAFNGKIHQLCCNKGFLYRGIPAIKTHANTVDDFLICY